jgi:HEPN domain-containing protein
VDEVFGFHAQQAAEKALKAWLTLLKDEYPKTHDLSLLLTLLETRGQDVTPYLELIELNPFAVQYRYGAFDDLSTLDRRATCELIQEVLSVVGSFVDMA